jgi:hypothetical protein
LPVDDAPEALFYKVCKKLNRKLKLHRERRYINLLLMLQHIIDILGYLIKIFVGEKEAIFLLQIAEPLAGCRDLLFNFFDAHVEEFREFNHV